MADRARDPLIDIFLGFIAEIFLAHHERMIAAFDEVEKIRRHYLRSNALEQIERTKRVARPLNKQDRSAQVSQNLIAQLRSIAHRTKRIAQTNQAGDIFFQRNMAANSAAHALADEKNRSGTLSSHGSECFSVRCN